MSVSHSLCVHAMITEGGCRGLPQFRYTLLCLAGLEAPLQLEIEGSTYGDDCIFIANDWHASMVPVYLAAKYRPGGVYNKARSVLAIHNLRHQVQQNCPI